MKSAIKLTVMFLLALLLALSPLAPRVIVARQTAPLLAQDSVQDEIVQTISEVIPLSKQAIRLILKPLLAQVTITPEQEMKIGDIFYQQLAGEMAEKLDRDRRDVAYLNQVGSQLAQNVKRPGIAYKFHIVEDSTINAFAIPGGHIFFYRGIMDFFVNEAQLAVVLGHEIGHIDAEHTIDYVKTVSVIDQLPVADEAKVIAHLTAKLLDRVYSEAQEIEADTIGTDLAFSACYETREGVKLWQRMMSMEGSDGNSNPVSDVIDAFFRSHPPSERRAENIAAQAERQHRLQPNKKTHIGVENYNSRRPVGNCVSS
ncbi:MAG: M48 family metalloprotease [Hormoscilla sp.]